MASASYIGSSLWSGLSYMGNTVSTKAQESGVVTPYMQEQASYLKEKTVETTSEIKRKSGQGFTIIGDRLVATKDNIVLSSKQIYE